MDRLKIVKYPWHTPHDYELAKLPHDFFFLTNTHREWGKKQRPIPKSIKWIPSANEIKTDLMILHVDQWTYNEPSKRFLFLRFRNSYKGPKIVINHGCNMVDGCSSEVMGDLVKGCVTVCNSSTAHKLWNLEDSYFVRHGLSAEEWPQTDYGLNNIVINQPYTELHSKFRNRAGVERAEKHVPITWIGRDQTFSSFDAYRRFLKVSSIFFNPSYASPNPRARTEAMLSGLAVVTTASHGEEEYIKNGINGFCSNDFDELIDFLIYLYGHPDIVKQIGREGRKTAEKVFSIGNFQSQWQTILANLGA